MKPEELEEEDSIKVSLLGNGSGEKIICDKVRKWKGQYVSLMVLENQSYVDYRMVFRAMRVELMGYEKQQKRVYEEGTEIHPNHHLDFVPGREALGWLKKPVRITGA